MVKEIEPTYSFRSLMGSQVFHRTWIAYKGVMNKQIEVGIGLTNRTLFGATNNLRLSLTPSPSGIR